MIPYEEWEIIRERENIEVRKDPYEPEGHGICIKNTGKIILFPRSTLKDLAQIKDIETGRAIIENLLPMTEKRGKFLRILI